MIGRTLVPKGASLASSEKAAARRIASFLDARTLVPTDLPVVPLDAVSTIPAHVPLDVLGKRVVVPRNLPVTPLETKTAIPNHLPLTVLDSRFVVPKGAKPPQVDALVGAPIQRIPELLEPDVLTTGDVNLLPRAIEAARLQLVWLARIASPLAHVLLLWLLVMWPQFFPAHLPTQQEIELAHRSLGLVYLPPPVTQVPRIPSPPSESPSANMRIDPRLLKQLFQPEREPSPMPAPRAERDLPVAPTPQTSRGDELGRLKRPPEQPQKRELAQLETQKTPPQTGQLVLPPTSPGRALDETLRGTARGRSSRGGEFGGPVPPQPGGGGGGGQGYLGGAMQMLTPDEGVDFTNYLARVLASVKRNWYAVIPESARLGEKGRVVIQFRIRKDGSVPPEELVLVMTSGRDPLDRAAMSSIRTSNPFEPLPPAFSGQYIELRFIFLYNLPIDYQ